MKEIKQYQAFDGKFFNNENECRHYEREISKKSIDILKQIKQICQSNDDCPDCPFYSSTVDDRTPCKLVEVMTSNFDDMCWFETPDNWEIGEE